MSGRSNLSTKEAHTHKQTIRITDTQETNFNHTDEKQLFESKKTIWSSTDWFDRHLVVIWIIKMVPNLSILLNCDLVDVTTWPYLRRKTIKKFQNKINHLTIEDKGTGNDGGNPARKFCMISWFVSIWRHRNNKYQNMEFISPIFPLHTLQKANKIQ